MYTHIALTLQPKECYFKVDCRQWLNINCKQMLKYFSGLYVLVINIICKIINLGPKGYKIIVMPLVCVCLCVCVCRHLTLYNFDIYWLIATILHVMIVEYDPQLIQWYHWHRSKVKVKVSTNMKNTLLFINVEMIVIEISNWYQNVSNSTHYHIDWSHLTLVQWPFLVMEVKFF
jgi:hypothetical protein